MGDSISTDAQIIQMRAHVLWYPAEVFSNHTVGGEIPEDAAQALIAVCEIGFLIL